MILYMISDVGWCLIYFSYSRLWKMIQTDYHSCSKGVETIN